MRQLLSIALSLALGWLPQLGGNSGVGGKAGFSGAAGVGGGTFTIVQACTNGGLSITTINCVFSSNFASGDDIYLIAQTSGASATLTFGLGSCTGISSISQPDGSIAAAGTATHGNGHATSTGACTVAFNSTVSGAMQVLALEISGSTSHTVDKHSLIYQGTLNQCPAVTTTVNGDLILCSFADAGQSAGTFTAGSGFTIPTGGQSTTFGIGIEDEKQNSAGAITPTWTYSANNAFMITGTLALEP